MEPTEAISNGSEKMDVPTDFPSANHFRYPTEKWRPTEFPSTIKNLPLVTTVDILYIIPSVANLVNGISPSALFNINILSGLIFYKFWVCVVSNKPNVLYMILIR